MIETILVYSLYNYYQINLAIDFTIISIAIVFPLVFSITSAYQRRQESILPLLNFAIKLSTYLISFAVNGVRKEDYDKLYNELLAAQSLLVEYIKSPSENGKFDLLRKRKTILILIDSYKQLFNEREKDSLIRVKTNFSCRLKNCEELKSTKRQSPYASTA